VKLSFVIPAYNEEKRIARCLEGILRNPSPDLLEILVIDNACTDKTAEIASKFPFVRVIHEPRKGLPHARQRGLMEMKGDMFVSLDADSFPPEGWSDILRREFADNPDLLCLSGPYDYYDLAPAKRTFIRWGWKLLARIGSILGNQVVGGNFVAKKDALLRMGGFDTSIRFYGEDVSTARRLKNIGQTKFSFDFFVYSSGRRFASNGLLRMSWIYTANFLSVFLFNKAATQDSEDIR
jgi:glycosyltransferase involved in cell wall biosynthesis